MGTSVKNTAFHEPHDYGLFDLAVSQTEILSIDFDQEVRAAGSDGPKIVYSKDNEDILVLTEENGLTMDVDRNTATFNLPGPSFQDYVGKTITCKMSFFQVGRIEFVFSVNILADSI